MTIEITSAYISNKVVTIEAIDCSQENLDYFSRVRDDGFEKIITYEFDTTNQKAMTAVLNFLKNQKNVRALKDRCTPTWGQCLQAIVGTITESPANRYRVWSY